MNKNLLESTDCIDELIKVEGYVGTAHRRVGRGGTEEGYRLLISNAEKTQ